MFQFRRSVFLIGYWLITASGLPHSEICVSLPICGSAQLFAAYRVLLRLLTPRHPPYALISLAIDWMMAASHLHPIALSLVISVPAYHIYALRAKTTSLLALGQILKADSLLWVCKTPTIEEKFLHPAFAFSPIQGYI